jgi:hypothetical protein
VLDGRHRLRACEELGREPRVREARPDDDPLALVVSLNLHRRHLTDSQRALIAAGLATMAQGRRTDRQPSATGPEVSQAGAATALQVSERSLRRAKIVRDHGAPELVAAVANGEVAVSAAANLARLPEDEQRAVLARSPDEIRAIAQEVKRRIADAGVVGPSAVKIFDRVAAEHDLTPIEQFAVGAVIKAETPPLPTPAEADRIAAAGPPGLIVLASDGRFHTAPGDPEEDACMERWLRLRDGLEPLGTLPFDAAAAFAAIPGYQRANVTAWLAHATPLLTELNQLWNQRHA